MIERQRLRNDRQPPEAALPKLPDLLVEGLHIVFCGTAAGARSAEVGAYYAGPGNSFWKTLKEVGLCDRMLAPEEFPLLAEYSIGLTDLAKHASGSDDSLKPDHFGVEELRAKIEQIHPKVLAFNGKRAAIEFLGRNPEYGLQEETIGKTAIFVLPSTSGAARRYWSLKEWQKLGTFAQSAGQ